MLLNTNNERNDAGRGRGRGRGRGAGRNRGNRGRGGARGDGNSASFSNVTVNEVRGDQSSRGRGNGFRAGMSPRAQRGNLETNRERVVNRADEFARLENLLNQTESNIFQFLTQLGSGDFGFGLLLNKNNPTPKQTRTVLNVLIKVANSEVMAEKRMRILLSSADSVFITSSLPQYFASYEYELTEEQFVKKTFEDAAVLAEKLFEICPTKALASLAVYLKTWIATVPISLKNGAFHRRVLALQQECATLKQKYEHLPPPIRDKEILRDFENQRPPPNDYRGLTVYPSYDDLKISAEESFIRSNIIKGPYKDGTHYLDVQFRLIKEDFVKPLRDGIRQYVSAVMNNSLKSVKNLDIKIYKNVKLMTPEMSMRSGIIYVIEFDMSELGKVNWSTTKRLMFGSLVCLTSDNFQSMIVATVVDTAAISSGRISVKLLRSSTDRFSPVTKYVMAESPSYYEACQHVLEGLQTLCPAKIPLYEHIVRVEKVVGCPGYLYGHSAWDFAPLLKDANDKRQFQRVTNLGPFPTPEQLGLDSAQHRALIMTLFRKFSIIQGPPGTGKTFIGYKIVEMLLHNKSLWYHHSPILVVCYTNHALDQFLEGILATGITDKLVRIGGQSKCEALKKYNLLSIRSQATKDKSTPGYLRNDNFVLSKKLRTLETDYQAVSKSLANLSSTLVHESKLHEYIQPWHYDQFGDYQSQLETANVDIPRSDGVPSMMYIWLEVKPSPPQLENTPTQNKKVDNVEITSDDEVEEEDADLVKDELNRRHLDGADGGWNNNEWKNAANAKKDNKKNKDFGLWLKSQPAGEEFKQRLYTETLNLNDVMSENQVQRIANIWHMSLAQRWKLYRTWLRGLRDSHLKKFDEKEEEFSQNFKELQELHERMDSVLLEDMDVIGMTTTGAAKFCKLTEHIKPRIVIVEEAAEIMEAQIIAALPTSTQHLILIGDHKQLRPNPTVYDLARIRHLDISLFERMINNNVKSEQLVKQHRMSPRIRQLLTPHIYSELVDAVSVLQYPKTNGMDKSIYFLSHSKAESGVSDTKSRKNLFESAFVSQLCSYLLKQNQYDYSRITVLTTYLGQLFQIKKDMNASELTRKVRCTVVDNFQGEENDVIILSLVRSNADENVGFLKIDNRICVALSRAKHCLYVIGNMSILEKQERSVWPKIIQDLKKDELIGETLTLSCGIHNTKTSIRNPEDFYRIPQGGCPLPCGSRMPCGHACIKRCHPDDLEHIEVSKKCVVVCNKMCARGLHSYEAACNVTKECVTPVEITFPKCRHVNRFPCNTAQLPPCPQACPHVMSCGHKCMMKCHMDNPDHRLMVQRCTIISAKQCKRQLHSYNIACNADVICTTLVDTLYPICGHSNLVRCDANLEKPPCKKPCEKKMPCGHLCQRVCHRDDYMHDRGAAQCTIQRVKKCDRDLHSYEVACNAKICCGVPVEVLYTSCGHKNMAPCDVRLTRPRCDKNCGKRMSCGHTCPRICHDDDQSHERGAALCTIQRVKTCDRGQHHYTAACNATKWCREPVEEFYYSCGHSNLVPCDVHLKRPPCGQKCGKQMSCGHICSRLCHSDDPDHSQEVIQCAEPVESEYPKCGHFNTVGCADSRPRPKKWYNAFVSATIDHSKFPPCSKPCSKDLPCGHRCWKTCGEVCPTDDCKEEVMVDAPCPHKAWVECKRSKNSAKETLAVPCFEACTTVLECGHRCEGNCSRCNKGEFHVRCSQQCSKLNVCGHRCTHTSNSCAPCSRQVELKCAHTSSRTQCGQLSMRCKAKCVWQCAHKKCSKLCSEDCDRDPCNIRCSLLLTCGHRCKGLCGEPCPKLCKTCDGPKLQEICFGTEEDADALFIQLEDCGHVLEYKGLDQYMNSKRSNLAGMKSCPKCAVPIYNSVRYHNVVNQCLRNVAAINEFVALARVVPADAYERILHISTKGSLFANAAKKLASAFQNGQPNAFPAAFKESIDALFCARGIELLSERSDIPEIMTKNLQRAAEWMESLPADCSRQQFIDLRNYSNLLYLMEGGIHYRELSKRSGSLRTAPQVGSKKANELLKSCFSEVGDLSSKSVGPDFQHQFWFVSPSGHVYYKDTERDCKHYSCTCCRGE